MNFRATTLAAFVFGAAACSPDVEQPQAEEGAETIECALGEGSSFGPDCLVEREELGDQRILIVRHPDGGFRRFEQLADGRGLVEVDGADPIARAISGDVLEIAVGNDRYRFPARVRDESAAAE